MNDRRFLVVNADDFGRSAGINRGIIQAREDGIVTSASLMVRYPAAREAAIYARTQPHFSIGLHVDLGEWVYQDDQWLALYQVVGLNDAFQVQEEVQHQLAEFRDLLGRDPTHLDSHQHVHRAEPVKSVLTEVANELRVPVRHFTPGIHYLGAFYGQSSRGEPMHAAISVQALHRLLVDLPPGATELSCHPGLGDDVPGMYRVERALEVDTLCDRRTREFIEEQGIVLQSFTSLSHLSADKSPPG